MTNLDKNNTEDSTPVEDKIEAVAAAISRDEEDENQVRRVSSQRKSFSVWPALFAVCLSEFEPLFRARGIDLSLTVHVLGEVLVLKFQSAPTESAGVSVQRLSW